MEHSAGPETSSVTAEAPPSNAKPRSRSAAALRDLHQPLCLAPAVGWL